MTDTQTAHIAETFVHRVRNDVLADIFHHLKDKVTATELASIFGMHPEQVHNLEHTKYRKQAPKRG